MRQRYVVVEGPIGCGKTSLVHKLAQRLNASMLLEDPGSNPFLRQFYSDMRRYALPTQLFFLMRLSFLQKQRRENVNVLDPNDWQMRLLHKALYSTYQDCVREGVGDEAKILLSQSSQSN